MIGMEELKGIPEKYTFTFRVFVTEEEYVVMLKRSETVDNFFFVAGLSDLQEVMGEEDEDDIAAGVAKFTGEDKAFVTLIAEEPLSEAQMNSAQYFVYMVPMDIVPDVVDVLDCLQDTLTITTDSTPVAEATEKLIASFSDRSLAKEMVVTHQGPSVAEPVNNEDLAGLLHSLIGSIKEVYVDDHGDLDDPSDYLNEDNYREILPHLAKLEELKYGIPSGLALDAAGISATKAASLYEKELYEAHELFMLKCVEVASIYEKIKTPENSSPRENEVLQECLAGMLATRRDILLRIKILTTELAGLQEYLHTAAAGIIDA